MKTFALVGKSGTGKSYRSLDIARENEIEAIVDDGLLISNGRIVAGISAKHEKTRMASVKRAIFADDFHASSVKKAINENNIGSILILGTSEEMVVKIADRLDLLPVEKIIRIEEIATPDEIAAASVMRNEYGKHIIPAPVFEVKKQFSGYFLKSLISSKRDSALEKTIMRPTYSYLGNFKISPNVFSDICRYEVAKINEVSRVLRFKSSSGFDGSINIYIEVSLTFPCNIPQVAEYIQHTIEKSIEESTSIIVKSVDVFVKDIFFN